MKKVYFYSMLVWILFAILAIINAGAREKIYKEPLGELPARQLSTVIFIGLMLGVMYLFFIKTKVEYSNSDLIYIGIMWTLGTLIFEFVFGHYVFGNSWEKLFRDYNILKGRIWILVLLTSLIGPRLVGRKQTF